MMVFMSCLRSSRLRCVASTFLLMPCRNAPASASSVWMLDASCATLACAGGGSFSSGFQGPFLPLWPTGVS